MARFHISADGTPGVCRAEKGKCPLGGADGMQNHFDTLEDAQAFADTEMAEDWVDEDHYDEQSEYMSNIMQDPKVFEEQMLGSYQSMGVKEKTANAPEFTRYDTPADTSLTPGFDEVKYEDLPHDDKFARLGSSDDQFDVWQWADNYGMTAYDSDMGELVSEEGEPSIDFDKDPSIRTDNDEPGTAEYADSDKISYNASMDSHTPAETLDYIKENIPNLYDDLQNDPAAKPFLYAAQHGDKTAGRTFDAYLEERALRAQDDYTVGSGRKSVFEYINNPDKY